MKKTEINNSNIRGTLIRNIGGNNNLVRILKGGHSNIKFKFLVKQNTQLISGEGNEIEEQV